MPLYLKLGTTTVTSAIFSEEGTQITHVDELCIRSEASEVLRGVICPDLHENGSKKINIGDAQKGFVEVYTSHRMGE
jgi:hypothetical protein